MTTTEQLHADLERIEQQQHNLRALREHWQGKPRTAYMSAESAKSLRGRLPRLAVNFPRLLVTSYVDRITLTGFKGSSGKSDPAAWDRHVAAGLKGRAELLHADRLMYGAAYATVWPEDSGAAVVLDNPFTMHADVDPITGRVARAVRTWTHRGTGYALTIEPGQITRWTTSAPDAGSAAQWTADGTLRNPWDVDGIVPVVPFLRRTSTADTTGTSVAADILGLTDAENKIIQDAMVTSEDYARPRRWATGLEIAEDDDGKPIDPFGTGRTAQSESPDTKFGQFDSARLDSYADMSATITQLIGAMTGLPPHYLGLHGDQPAAAEGVRAAEVQLTSRVYSELAQLDEPWGQLAGLLELATDRNLTTPDKYTPEWDSPEIRTPAQAADAAVKLKGIGVPLAPILSGTLGWTPEQVAEALDARRDDLIDRAATTGLVAGTEL